MMFRKDFDVNQAPVAPSDAPQSFMDKHCPYINQGKTVIGRFSLGKFQVKDEPITLSIDGEEQIPSTSYPTEQNGQRRDMYGKKIPEERSRWAKIGESIEHMDVQDLYNKMSTMNRAIESRAEYETLY